MKIREILEKTVTGLGFELVGVEITHTKLIRVFIDNADGVTIDDCEMVSNHLSKLFLVEDIDYNRLEVSSPGVERPLTHLKDYVKFIGKMVKVKTKELINDQKVFQGIIKDVKKEVIKLELENKEVIEIEFTNINRARLVFEIKSNKISKLKTKK
ncbi:MAG TPA: ribosome maturation factor RimP [Burkholderiales bacterium]|nr:ribosome maturation factor RimP [Burkholderiales bacterium]